MVSLSLNDAPIWPFSGNNTPREGAHTIAKLNIACVQFKHLCDTYHIWIANSPGPAPVHLVITMEIS